MYSDTDLESAISAGVLSHDTATAFRTHVSSLRATPLADEEQFRLLSGFNDIFVAIAGVLLLVGLGWAGGAMTPALGAALVAAASWGLAEYFTRIRRMALPSILFLLSFVGGTFVAGAMLLLGPKANLGDGSPITALLTAAAASVAAGAAWLHWRRFSVPITVAAGAAALVGVVLSLVLSAVPVFKLVINPLMFAAGLCVFALAMRWDMSDPLRQTRRSDVAFWLHLLAAPLIVHPVFAMLGVFENQGNVLTALIVLLVYVGLGIVALAIDRRALMVSALAYVLVAVTTLFRQVGDVGINVALTVLIIGSALLLLSAFWQTLRAKVIQLLPGTIGGRLPPTERQLTLRPAS